MYHLSLTLLLALILTPCAYSQRTISYRLILFGKGEIENGAYVNSSRSKDEVRVIPGYVADPTRAKLRDNQFLDFHKKGEKGGPKHSSKPDFSIEVPSDAGKDLLIVLYQDGAELSQKIVEFKKLKMKDGDRVLLNFLSVPVAVRFSDPEGEKWDEPTQVEAGAQGRIPAPGFPSVMWEVSAKVVVPTEDADDGWVVFKKGLVMASKGSNEILCSYMKDGDDQPTLEMMRIHKVRR